MSGDHVVGETLRVSPAVGIPLDEVAFRYETSGGAGGQHANRSHTRVELTFNAATSPSLSAAQRERIVSKLGGVVSAGAADSRSADPQPRSRARATRQEARRGVARGPAVAADPTDQGVDPRAA